MKKNCIKLIESCMMISALAITSCAKKTAEPVQDQFENIKEISKNHKWFYFTESGFSKIDLPQNAPKISEKPWTEAVRISSAASVVSDFETEYSAFAIVNKKGVLAMNGAAAELYCDNSIFDSDTADSIVFSNGMPVFYLYRSTFFNENLDAKNIQSSRPFLVEFNPSTKVCYPLVSYENLRLDDMSQISGFFWNGSTWTCAAKKEITDGIEFTYFFWQPLLPLADLNPALGQETFLFENLDEQSWKEISTPKLFSQAPSELKNLLKSIPEEFPFYVSFRDNSGTSPIHYYQAGSGGTPLNAKAMTSVAGEFNRWIVCMFEDGTVYAQNEDSTVAFRLPLLPANFKYSEVAVSDTTLYASWEETNFYMTSRAGFLTVDLEKIIK